MSGRIELHGPPRPLTTLRVTLHDVVTIRNASSQVVRRTAPDAQGRFDFSDVADGIYLLEVDGTGILSAQWGALGPELAGQALVVRADSGVRDLVVPVTSRPVLCGRVFLPNGSPLANASVQGWKTDAAGAGSSMSAADEFGVSDGGGTTTDADGRYRFDFFNPGYYIVGASATTYEAAAQIKLTADGAPDKCLYDLRLQSVQAPKPYSGQRYSVEGSLADANVPVGARKLQWVLAPLDAARLPEDWPKPVPFDPATPIFAFTGVAPGQYRLTLAPHPIRSFSGSCFPFERTEASQELTADSDVRDVRAALRPVATIRGRIEEVHTLHDMDWPRSPGDRYYVRLLDRGRCTGTNAAPDGTFTIADLDAGDYFIGASLPVAGLYTASVELNGVPAPEGAIHLEPGENIVTMTQRFDSGSLDAPIQGQTVAGAPDPDEHRQWHGGGEQAFLIDGKGKRFGTSFGVADGALKGYLPPGRYTAVAGANERLTWTWVNPEWNDEKVLMAMTALGTSFTIKAGKTATPVLQDRTVELQNLMAKLGLPIDRR